MDYRSFTNFHSLPLTLDTHLLRGSDGDDTEVRHETTKPAGKPRRKGPPAARACVLCERPAPPRRCFCDDCLAEIGAGD